MSIISGMSWRVVVQDGGKKNVVSAVGICEMMIDDYEVEGHLLQPMIDEVDRHEAHYFYLQSLLNSCSYDVLSWQHRMLFPHMLLP